VEATLVSGDADGRSSLTESGGACRGSLDLRSAFKLHGWSPSRLGGCERPTSSHFLIGGAAGFLPCVYGAGGGRPARGRTWPGSGRGCCFPRHEAACRSRISIGLFGRKGI